MISRIDHVAIAVRNYEKALEFFQNVLGAVPGASGEEAGLKFYWKNFALGDLTRLELLTPMGQGSFLDKFLKGKEGGVHHITLQTPDIGKAKQMLEEKGIPYFGYNEYPGGVWKEVFIHPKDAFGVLIQIAEFRPDDWIAESVKFKWPRRWLVESRGDGAAVTFAHPGGGKVAVELNEKEVNKLIEDLRKAIK